MPRKAVFGLALMLSVIWATDPVVCAKEKGTVELADSNSVNEQEAGLQPTIDEATKPDVKSALGKAPVSAAPVSAAPVSAAPVSAAPVPAAPVPAAPVKIEIAAAYLYTKGYGNGQEFELISADNDTINKTHFQAGAKTYVIIHGFTSRASEPWIISLKDKILERETGSNVVAVEWATPFGSNFSYEVYNQTLEYIPGYGASVQRLVTALHLAKHVDYEDVHLIGLNLGAHIAGFAGKASPSPFGRITDAVPLLSSSQGDYFLNTSTSRPYALQDPDCPTRQREEMLTDAAIAAIVISVLIIVFLGIFVVLYKVKRIWVKKSDDATERLIKGEDDDNSRIVDGQEQPRESSILHGVARGFADVINRPVDV
ncbi:Lipase/vitellogenin [Trinorchestia longiramus]|nr:Lipase/vitellogenin [Trinorchestia longiramus]